MDRGPGDNPLAGSATGRRYDAAALLLAAAVLIAIRLHAFALPLETDECNYAYIGARLLGPDRLYIDVWDHQPPGIFILFAAVIAPFGDAPEAFRWMAVLASLGTMVLIFAIVRPAAGRGAAYLAAGLFALCSADPGMAGEGCNREIFMNPLALAAVWLLVRRQPPARLEVLLAGLLLGLGSTIKTVMAAQWLLLLAWLIVRTWIDTGPDKRFRSVGAAVGLFGVGPAVVWAATLAYFAATGRFDQIYEAVFAFNLGYSDVSAGYWQRFADFFLAPIHQYVFESTGPLWLAAGVSAAALPFVRRGRGFAIEAALLCYLVGSYWAVSAGAVLASLLLLDAPAAGDRAGCCPGTSGDTAVRIALRPPGSLAGLGRGVDRGPLAADVAGPGLPTGAAAADCGQAVRLARSVGPGPGPERRQGHRSR